MTLDTKQMGFLLGAIPGSVVPSVWSIRHSSGHQASVDLDGHVANIPGALTVWDHAVQNHEQGHIRWDLPSQALGVLAPALLMPSVIPWYKMMREWVIDYRLVLEGITPDPRIGMDRFDWSNMPDPSAMAEELIAQSWCQYAYVYTGSKSVDLSNYTGELWGLLPQPVRDLLTPAFNDVVSLGNAYNDDVSASWAVKLAAHWDTTRTAPQRPPSQMSLAYTDATQNASQSAQKAQAQASTVASVLAPNSAPIMEAMHSVGQMIGQALAPQPSKEGATGGAGGLVKLAMSSTPRPKPATTSTKKKPASSGKGPTKSTWNGNITICDHLSLARPGKRLKAPKGASEEGVVIVDLPRVFQDRRPFKNAPRPAGTIIVDTSGSMHWQVSELEEVIRRCPGVVVGLYNERGRPSQREWGARICIVARDGRRADIEEWEQNCPTNSSNMGSDLPALQWLADRHQKGPKFILSDGDFHQGGAGNSSLYQDDCAAVMRAAHILRVPQLQDMVDIANHRSANISDGSMKHGVTKRRANNR